MVTLSSEALISLGNVWPNRSEKGAFFILTIKGGFSRCILMQKI